MTRNTTGRKKYAWSAFLPSGTKILSVVRFASLWAGYGSISRIAVQPASVADPHTYIVKEIDLQNDGEGDAGHMRKLTSYQVESAFYSENGLAQSVFASAPWLTIPRPLGVLVNEETISITMSDLLPLFPESQDDLDLLHAKSALRWLAQWHAHFWGNEEDDSNGLVSKSGVWKEGNYWHLSTRMEEFDAVGPNPRWKPIKGAAKNVAALLRGETTAADRRFRTLLHGDPKAANILFAPATAGPTADEDIIGCAFYDFQYVGYGFGAVDVAYLLATSVRGTVLGANEDELLEWYHAELVSRLAGRGLEADAREYTMEAFRKHLGHALVDWVRFMAGWGLWGNVKWAEEKAKRTLSSPGAPPPS